MNWQTGLSITIKKTKTYRLLHQQWGRLTCVHQDLFPFTFILFAFATTGLAIGSCAPKDLPSTACEHPDLHCPEPASFPTLQSSLHFMYNVLASMVNGSLSSLNLQENNYMPMPKRVSSTENYAKMKHSVVIIALFQLNAQ